MSDLAHDSTVTLYYGKVKSDGETIRQYRTPGRCEIISEVATLTEVQRIARRLASAEARADKLRAERDAAIVAAHDRGESPSLIAIAAGLSEQGVFKILRAAREGK